MRLFLYAALVVAVVSVAALADEPTAARRLDSKRPAQGAHVIQIRGKYHPVQKLQVNDSDLSGSGFQMVRMTGSFFEKANLGGLRFGEVNLQRARITNADLSDLEIDGAQLGGAFLHNIGLPPKGHPAYVEGAKQRPLRFEECDLQGSTIKSSNLSGVSIRDCDLKGMTIDGIPVEEMMKAYRAKQAANPSVRAR